MKNRQKLLLAIPAFIGFLLNAPLYLPVKLFVRTKTINNDHYDSVLLALLIFLYPFYLIISSLLLFIFSQWWMSLLALLILPFTAWAYVQLKDQFDAAEKEFSKLGTQLIEN